MSSDREQWKKPAGAGVSWSAIAWIIALNLVIRGGWLLYMHPPQSSDFLWYFREAVSIDQGHGYTFDGRPTAYWPVGYVYFLSLLFRTTGISLAAGLIANAILSVGIVVLVYMVTLRVTESRAVAAAAAIGYTLLPSQIAWNSILGSEELFTFLLYLSLYVYLMATETSRLWGRLAVSAGLMGMACVVRPTVELFPFFLLAYEWWIQRLRFRQALLKVLVFTAIMFLTVSPVTIRNYTVMHHFVLVSTNGGVNLWQGTKVNDGYYWSKNPAINPLYKLETHEVLRDQVGKKLFEEYVVQHPRLFVLNGFQKIFALYKDDRSVFYFFHNVNMPHWEGRLYVLAQRFSTSVYLLWMAVAVVGFLTMAFRRMKVRPSVMLLLTFVVYNTAVFFVFPAWDRFRYPMMPLFAVEFGLGVIWLGRLFGLFLPKRGATGRKKLE
ncbi:MAG: hypothetical protein A2201_05515 [Alicyclobacillus sp. RIFOXYA1_FULL_53_8]|nr:MAG: hypothetical protein A2201_05515 [Alicyclobacillus sp. RIFOXYA1_FULL_53_8]